VSTQPQAAKSLADGVREAVLLVDGVASTHTGTFGEVATYLPGRRVDGVRLRPDRAEVHVVLRWGAPVGPTADAIRAVTTAMTPGPGAAGTSRSGTQVDVVIQDVAAPAGFVGRTSAQPSTTNEGERK